MVGINFIIVHSAKRGVKFEEKLHSYLLKKLNNQGNEYDLLIRLDPYGNRLFTVQEINELINICVSLMNKYTKDDWDENRVRKFSKKLLELCELALEQRKVIEAIGD
ncbi:hypothetical protein [Cytobacillus firmus]|uniref:hypothetical protein n=1 Tax=Cytobacillus firmus TaxID=1399 RepID=UPI0022282238|nr:hypothetical protein [Cytobacillus firmus]